MATESLLVPNIPQVVPPELRPNVEHLVTEDDTPVDNIFSEKQQRLLTEPLYSSPEWAGKNRKFVALANVGLFYAMGEPPFVPDMLLSRNVQVPDDLWPKSHRSYFVWGYKKPPDAVVEVVSNRKGGETTVKWCKYAKIGIAHYVIFDPQTLLLDQPLCVHHLQGNAYVPVDDPRWLHELGLGLMLWEGRFEDHTDTWLRWIDRDGNPIATGAERSERERLRANQERTRANQESRRAERLAEQLRQLGVDPDA